LIAASVVQRPKKKFVPPIKVSENLLSEQNMETIKSQHEKRLTENTNKEKSLKKVSLQTKKSNLLQLLTLHQSHQHLV
jgi:hypothetical protein